MKIVGIAASRTSRTVGAILVIALFAGNTYRRANTRFAPTKNRTPRVMPVFRGHLEMPHFQVNGHGGCSFLARDVFGLESFSRMAFIAGPFAAEAVTSLCS
jgi:hypothetical protein